jgi:hypothetical protein
MPTNNFLENVMNHEYEFDYEDMDELALPERIGWNNDPVESFSLEALELDQW